jgi:hypothetical protein
MPRSVTDQTQLMFSFGLLALVAFGIVLTIRRRGLAKKAAQWPLAEAMIESGQVEAVAGGGRSPKVSLPVFAFSYQVEGEYYSGRFALLPYITSIDELFVSRMIGRNLKVHHDPRQPAVVVHRRRTV